MTKRSEVSGFNEITSVLNNRIVYNIHKCKEWGV